jgi:preprotein translocase subunit SecA
MFGSMMKAIAQDFVRYVMHVQVVRPDQQQAAAAPAQGAAPAAGPAATPAQASAVAPAVSNLQQVSSDTERVSAFAAAAAAAPAAERELVEQSAAARPSGVAGGRVARRQPQMPRQETVVKDEWSKTPRNAPCPCGSGKKFKLCHGK